MDFASLALLAQETTDTAPELIGTVMGLAMAAATIAGFWGVFKKAGKPGWASLIPIYNLVVLLQIVGAPLWCLVFFLIPMVNFGASLWLSWRLARSFGKGVLAFMGIMFLPFVTLPVLGFGGATYQREG